MDEATARPDPARPHGARHARRVLVAGALALAVVVASGALLTACAPEPGRPRGAGTATRTGRPSPSPSPLTALQPAGSTGTPATTVGYPESGTGQWRAALTGGPEAGTRGPLLRYRVAVEVGIDGVDAQQFADTVSGLLADPRGWTADGAVRLQLVGAGAPSDFTVYLATPATRDVLCASAYDRYTSCRNGNAVVLNVARWAHGVPGYGADLPDYRAYMVNHETGHRLGYGHELCPGPGRPAPVMQQQTLGMHGCVPNSWHVVNGRAYDGPSGQYDDPIPPGA